MLATSPALGGIARRVLGACGGLRLPLPRAPFTRPHAGTRSALSCAATRDIISVVVPPQPHPPPYTKTHCSALVDPTDRSGALAIQSEFHGGSGTVVRHSLLNEVSRQESTLQLWTIEPGASEGMHVHAGQSSGRAGPDLGALEEIYVCLRGSGHVNLRRPCGILEDVPLAPGDAIQIPQGVAHGVTNSGALYLQLLIMWGPPAPADKIIVRE